jgi:hypothetical protein
VFYYFLSPKTTLLYHMYYRSVRGEGNYVHNHSSGNLGREKLNRNCNNIVLRSLWGIRYKKCTRHVERLETSATLCVRAAHTAASHWAVKISSRSHATASHAATAHATTAHATTAHAATAHAAATHTAAHATSSHAAAHATSQATAHAAAAHAHSSTAAAAAHAASASLHATSGAHAAVTPHASFLKEKENTDEERYISDHVHVLFNQCCGSWIWFLFDPGPGSRIRNWFYSGSHISRA